MTEKRFVSIDDGLDFSIKDTESGEVFYDCDSVVELLNGLAEENSKLHIQNDFLKDENQHMRWLVNKNEQLQERNNRQAKQLGNIYHLIEKQDWKALKGIIEEFKECEEQLQKEWKCYE